mgnify:CR=1 FL=1
MSAWAVALLLGQVSLVHAQENEESHFWASAQIRTRGEYRNGALSPRGEGDKPAGFINERARLTLGYERKKLSLKFSAQHVGVIGGRMRWLTKNGRFYIERGLGCIPSE